MQQTICGIVVTYQPTLEDLSGLKKIRSQVNTLCVVDNGSDGTIAQYLREAAHQLSFRLIENGSNRGLASGLNTGVQIAEALGCTWAVLFDQDSQAPEAYVTEMLSAFRAHPDAKRLAILVPRYFDVHLGCELKTRRTEDDGLLVAMTSGSLMPLRIFAEVGYFEECLFVDGVDYEFCLRLKRRGYRIDCAERVLLAHAPAQKQRHRLLRVFPFVSGYCAPVRHYYQVRNAIWILRHYGAAFPGFCAGQLWILTKNIVKALLAEQDKAAKFLLWSEGIRDGVLCRMGAKKTS